MALGIHEQQRAVENIRRLVFDLIDRGRLLSSDCVILVS